MATIPNAPAAMMPTTATRILLPGNDLHQPAAGEAIFMGLGIVTVPTGGIDEKYVTRSLLCRLQGRR